MRGERGDGRPVSVWTDQRISDASTSIRRGGGGGGGGGASKRALDIALPLILNLVLERFHGRNFDGGGDREEY